MKKVFLFAFFTFFVCFMFAQNELTQFSKKTTPIDQLLCLHNSSEDANESSALLQDSYRTEPRPWSFYGMATATYGMGINDNANLLGIDFIGGFRLGFFTHIGMGIGLYVDKGEDLYSHIPFYLELRNTYSRSKVCPFTTFNLGYAFPNGRASKPSSLISGVINGGPMIGFSVGARYTLSRKAAVNVSLGYGGHLSTVLISRAVSDSKAIAVQEIPIFLHTIRITFGLMF